MLAVKEQNTIEKTSQVEVINASTRATTDEQIISLWLSMKHSLLTKKNYLSEIKRFFKFTGLSIHQVRVEDVQNYQDSLTVKASTKSWKLAVLKSLFTFCLNVGYLKVNPLILFKVKKEGKKAKKTLSKDNTNFLLDNVKNLRDKLILKTIYKLGLRVSEVISLSRDSLTENEGIFTLQVYGKGSKYRVLRVQKELFLELKDYLKSHKSEFIFPNKKNKKLTRNYINQVLNRIADNTDLPDNLSPHWLRHSHATQALLNGCDVNTLRESLGHNSLTTTMTYLDTMNQCSTDYV